jgi:hypothetical protein
VNRIDARQIMNATLSLNDGIGKIDDIISNMTDEDEKKIWVRKLGGLMGYLLEEILRPIVREYPDLDAHLTK